MQSNLPEIVDKKNEKNPQNNMYNIFHICMKKLF